MKTNNWEKAKEIFGDAIKFAPDERIRFLDKICDGDKTVRREVESLLASYDEAESFMESPAVGKVADVIEVESKKLETGRCFGHYEIIKQIGAGGMGEVYLAKDTKLDRQVAVKILNEKFSRDESNLNRFIQEAKAASALNHPNILVIHEIGEAADTHFIVSEFIKGETLREIFKEKTLKLSEVLDISIQIANALCTAHEAHLVHRDIKPENIMIRPDGFVKILDFGLAKLVEQKSIGFEDVTVKQNQTAKGMILGTVKYMSPEQAKGERVDERTDVFSFGVVIYEMMAGRTPFAGDSMPETFANLINAELPPLSRFAANVPDELQRIVSKTLRKNKDERYQTMSGLLADLKSLRENLAFDEHLEKSHTPIDRNTTAILEATTGDANKTTAETNYNFARQIKRHKPLAAVALVVLLAAIGLGVWQFTNFSANTQIESIAVLPFENQNPEAEYLSDGLTESVINNLTNLPNLRVISRNSVFRYKGKETEPAAVGQELNVRAVLTGRFIQRGNDLLVSAEVTDLRDNRQIWKQQYNRKVTDAFALQQEISRDVSATLRPKLTGERQPAKRETDNAEAYQFYLKGRFHLNKRTDEGFAKALEFFNQAIEKDPKFAAAFAGLAESYLLGNYKNLSHSEKAAKTQTAAQKALEIDEQLGEAHTTLGYIKLYEEWDWASADREYRRAVELSPHYATAHQRYGKFLATEGRFDESFAEYNRALELDPFSPAVSADLGLTYYYARQYDRAIEHLKKLKKADPNYDRTYFNLAKVYQKKEMFEEAIAEFAKGYALQGEDAQITAKRTTSLENALRTSGVKAYWQKVLEANVAGGNPDSMTMVKIYIGTGEYDKVFEFLEKAYQERNGGLVWLKISPEFDNIRSDPRFQDLLRRMGLPQ